MTLFEYLERVKEAFPDKHRTRITMDLNHRIADFCRETKILTASENLFTQALVDSFGNSLVTEGGELLVSSRYGSVFPLPWDCYALTHVEEPSEAYTYSLQHGELRFYSSGNLVTFESTTSVSITLHFTQKPASLFDDSDEPAFPEDFHEGPLYALLADYAAMARDKMHDYWRAQAQLKVQEAKVYATKLRRESYDVKPLDWRK